MIFIPEPCDWVLCCLKFYTCSLVPHTNLCSCHSCYTHQPCYQPNHTGSIWLRRKARSPGESVPRLAPARLWLWILCLRTDPFTHMLSWKDEGAGCLGLGRNEKEEKDRGGKGKSEQGLGCSSVRRTSLPTEHGIQVWIACRVRMSTLIGVTLLDPDRFFHNQWTFPVIPWERPSEGIKIMWIYFNLLFLLCLCLY